jgi:YrhK-like protein
MTTEPATTGGESRLRWIAWLFIIGSALFGLGATPLYADTVGLRVSSLTFFVGSLFFTAAAFLQYREAVDGLPAATGSHRGRFWVWAPGNIVWLACAVQLAGTLWFNWSTGNALRSNLGVEAEDQRVWRPDALGSIAFLVASVLAFLDASRGVVAGRSKPMDWWIGIVNLLGSIAFGVSAVAAYVLPSGNLRNAELSNLGTLVGAVCFLVGAILLLVPRKLDAPSTPGTTSQSS